MTASQYATLQSALVAGGLNFAADTVKAMLCTSGYTPNPLTDQFKSSVTSEVTGTGYTAGGVTLTSKTATLTAANSWGTSRANSTAYALGDVVRPATGNGYLYQAVAAGTSGASVPTYPTVVGQTVVDGGAIWVCKGRAVVAVDCADPSWASASITARTIVFYKDTGSAATSQLIAYDTFAGDVTSTNGPWTYQVAAAGFLLLFID